ncbi:efflux transporter outer membrane subunit [Sphingobacterium hungaricum]
MLKNKSWIILFSILILMLESCKVVQPYQQPSVDHPDVFRHVPNSDTTSIASIPWRTIFTDQKLQALIQEGIENNLDLKIATARVKAAQANLAQSKVAFYPNLSANASVTYQKVNANMINMNQPYQLSASSSWELDIWGKLSSLKRASLAAFLQSEAYQRAVQTELIASIASQYYALLALDQQLKISLKTVENRKSDVATMKLLKESDVVTGADVVQSQASELSLTATIPDLKQNIREMENAISILLGRAPGNIDRDSLSNQSIAVDLNIGIPSQLLANRPDVQQAEYQFRYSFELTNVARTYFYPTLSITAQGGLSNSSLSDFFNASSVFANILAGLTQPIFNNGLNKQRLAVAQATQEESFSTFKQSLLSAGAEVSNALYNYQMALEKIEIRKQEIFYLQKSVEFTQELLKYSSNTNYNDVLASEQNLLNAELNSISDKLQQLQATVELYRSLGGGVK